MCKRPLQHPSPLRILVRVAAQRLPSQLRATIQSLPCGDVQLNRETTRYILRQDVPFLELPSTNPISLPWLLLGVPAAVVGIALVPPALVLLYFKTLGSVYISAFTKTMRAMLEGGKGSRPAVLPLMALLLISLPALVPVVLALLIVQGLLGAPRAIIVTHNKRSVAHGFQYLAGLVYAMEYRVNKFAYAQTPSEQVHWASWLPMSWALYAQPYMPASEFDEGSDSMVPVSIVGKRPRYRPRGLRKPRTDDHGTVVDMTMAGHDVPGVGITRIGPEGKWYPPVQHAPGAVSAVSPPPAGHAHLAAMPGASGPAAPGAPLGVPLPRVLVNGAPKSEEEAEAEAAANVYSYYYPELAAAAAALGSPGARAWLAARAGTAADGGAGEPTVVIPGGAAVAGGDGTAPGSPSRLGTVSLGELPIIATPSAVVHLPPPPPKVPTRPRTSWCLCCAPALDDDEEDDQAGAPYEASSPGALTMAAMAEQRRREDLRQKQRAMQGEDAGWDEDDVPQPPCCACCITVEVVDEQAQASQKRAAAARAAALAKAAAVVPARAAPEPSPAAVPGQPVTVADVVLHGEPIVDEQPAPAAAPAPALAAMPAAAAPASPAAGLVLDVAAVNLRERRGLGAAPLTVDVEDSAALPAAARRSVSPSGGARGGAGAQPLEALPLPEPVPTPTAAAGVAARAGTFALPASVASSTGVGRGPASPASPAPSPPGSAARADAAAAAAAAAAALSPANSQASAALMKAADVMAAASAAAAAARQARSVRRQRTGSPGGSGAAESPAGAPGSSDSGVSGFAPGGGFRASGSSRHEAAPTEAGGAAAGSSRVSAAAPGVAAGAAGPSSSLSSSRAGVGSVAPIAEEGHSEYDDSDGDDYGAAAAPASNSAAAAVAVAAGAPLSQLPPPQNRHAAAHGAEDAGGDDEYGSGEEDDDDDEEEDEEEMTVLAPIVRPDLPDQWVQATAQDGSVYYVNYARNQSMWRIPPGW